jgi:hypothetical protein
MESGNKEIPAEGKHAVRVIVATRCNAAIRAVHSVSLSLNGLLIDSISFINRSLSHSLYPT